MNYKPILLYFTTIFIAILAIASFSAYGKSIKHNIDDMNIASSIGDYVLLQGTVPLDNELYDSILLEITYNASMFTNTKYFAVTAIDEIGSYKFVSVVGLHFPEYPVNDWNIIDNGAWFGLVLLSKSEHGSWEVAIAGTKKFSSMLYNIPNHLLPAKSKISMISAYEYPLMVKENYILPWGEGTSMKFGRKGIHGSEFTNFSGRIAVDWVSDGGPGHAPNNVIASQSGSVIYRCDNGRPSTAIIIGNFLYAHLLRSNNYKVGDYYEQGQSLGALRVGPFDDGKCGYAHQSNFQYHVHWAFPNEEITASGWTLNRATEQWVKGDEHVGVNQWLFRGNTSPTCSLPALISPSDGESINSRTVSLRWIASNCAGLTGYTLRITTSPDPNQGKIFDLETSSTEYVYTFSHDGTFYWHVAPKYGSTRGEWASRRIVIDTTARPTPTPIPADQWRAEYFNSLDLGSKCGETSLNLPFLFYDWGDDPPVSSCRADNWSARFTRQVEFPGGRYRFRLFYDDDARLKVDGRVLIDAWNHDVIAPPHDGEIDLSPGTHEVQVEFRDWGGWAIIAAYWYGPGFEVPFEDRDEEQWYGEYWGQNHGFGESWEGVIKANEGKGFLEKNWGEGGPGYGLPSDRFTVRYKRKVYFQCGRYRFTYGSDDGMRFKVGEDEPWWDDSLWYDHGYSPKTMERDVSEGWHDIVVEYYERTGWAQLSFEWELLKRCTPSRPTLTLPPTEALVTEGDTIMLTWTGDSEQYWAEYGKQGQSASAHREWSSETQWQIGPLEPGYVYQWRVKARNGTGSTAAESAWSNTWTFTVRPATPTDVRATATACDTVQVTWRDTSEAEDGFNIYRDGQLIGHVGANMTSYTDTGLSGDTTYTYIVTAVTNNVESFNSDGASVSTPSCETPNHPPNVPTQLSPPDGSTHTSMPQLCWQDNGDPDGDSVEFWVDLMGATYEQSGWITDTCWKPSATALGTYSWHVQARDENGDKSDYSSDWTFTLENGENCLAASPHPYENDTDRRWEIANPDTSAASSRVHFTRISTEQGYDYVYVEDEAGTKYDEFSGNYEDVWSEPVPGNKVFVHLVSDYSMPEWGFCVDAIETASSGGGEAVMSVLPSEQEGFSSDTSITTTVAISDVSNLGGFQFTLTYDPAVVHVEDATLGDFLDSTGRSAYPLSPQIDNTTGRVTFGGYTLGNQPGASGSGTLAVITFSPQGAGETDLALQGAQVTDTTGATLSLSTQNGHLAVRACPRWDVDCDGDVDISDIMQVAAHWNCEQGDACYDSKYDIDQDGDIDVADIMQVAAHWNCARGDACYGGGMAFRLPHEEGVLNVSLPSVRLSMGEETTIPVRVERASRLGGLEFTLAYDPNVIEITGVEQGSWESGPGRRTVMLKPQWEEEEGRVRIGLFSYGERTEAEDSGDVLYIHVRAIAEGASRLEIQALQAVSDSGVSIEADTTEGYITVGRGQNLYLPVLLWR